MYKDLKSISKVSTKKKYLREVETTVKKHALSKTLSIKKNHFSVMLGCCDHE